MNVAKDHPVFEWRRVEGWPPHEEGNLHCTGCRGSYVPPSIHEGCGGVIHREVDDEPDDTYLYAECDRCDALVSF